MFNMVPFTKQRSGEMGGELSRLRNEMDSLIQRFFGDNRTPDEFFGSGWIPSVDVSETEDEITVRAELPGIEKDKINLSVDGRFLSIRGEKSQSEEEKRENYHRVERAYGSFERRLELPAEVGEGDIDATYADGILSVKMKKAENSRIRKINVKAA